MKAFTQGFQLELKSLGDQGSFAGYASTFGNVDLAGDTFAPGSFKSSIEAHRKNGTAPALLRDHQPHQPIGMEGGRGRFRRPARRGQADAGGATRPRNPRADERRGLRGLSVGFRPVKAKTDTKNGVRIFHQVDLHEISLVAMPANPAALITAVKSAEDLTLRQFEDVLRELGFTRSRAALIASKGFRAAYPLASDGLQREAAASSMGNGLAELLMQQAARFKK